MRLLTCAACPDPGQGTSRRLTWVFTRIRALRQVSVLSSRSLIETTLFHVGAFAATLSSWTRLRVENAVYWAHLFIGTSLICWDGSHNVANETAGLLTVRALSISADLKPRQPPKHAPSTSLGRGWTTKCWTFGSILSGLPLGGKSELERGTAKGPPQRLPQQRAAVSSPSR